ncbi:MAG: hypothetical protein IT210_08380 [Armatimonadetes bacterium]|nr:hypothetical protein [Armatimonadota bacterium]
MSTNNEWTSRKRLLAAFHRQQPDRVPIQVRGVLAWDEGWAASRHPSFRPLIESVSENGDMVASWGIPYGFFASATELPTESLTHDAGDWVLYETIVRTPKGPLSSITRVSRKDYPSLVQKFWVEDEADLERFLSIPYIPVRPDVGAYFDLERRVGERALVIATFVDPICFVHELVGSELLAVWSLESPAVIDQLIDLFTERLHDLLDHLIGQGMTGAYAMLGEEYAGPPLMPPKAFRRWVTACEVSLAERIHRAGGLLHIHCHGPMQDILEEFVTIGADCLHPIEAPPLGDMPLKEAKKRVGAHICLEGNIQVGDLYAASIEQIREMTRQAIEDAAPGGGFILCPSASPYTRVLPAKAAENYLAMIETAVEYGKY